MVICESRIGFKNIVLCYSLQLLNVFYRHMFAYKYNHRYSVIPLSLIIYLWRLWQNSFCIMLYLCNSYLLYLHVIVLQNSHEILSMWISCSRLVVPFKKFLHVLLLVEHLALAVCKGNQTLVAVLLQGVSAHFEHFRQFLVRHVAYTVQQMLIAMLKEVIYSILLVWLLILSTVFLEALMTV